jgi:hypothetical protein
MRASKWIALALAAALSSSALTGCNVLRTPYERQKIQEKGGSVKKKEETGASEIGGGGGEGGDNKGGGKQKEDPKVAQEKKEGQKTVRKGRAESLGEKKEREKGQGLIYLLPDHAKSRIQKDLQDAKKAGQPGDQKDAKPQAAQTKHAPKQAPQLQYNRNLSAEVSKLEGVTNATVLIDGKHNAFVALNEYGNETAKTVKAPREANEKLGVKTEGRIPQPVQESIAKKLRKIDPGIKTVHITSDPEHVKSFQRYVTTTSQGNVDINVHALADHIQDIWN